MAGILLITKRIHERPAGGREMLCKLNRDCLRDIFGDALSVLELDARPVSGVHQVLEAFQGRIDGVSAAVIAEAAREIERKEISCVFLDGSNLGEIAAQLKRRARDVSIVSFFHNVESRFFLGSFKASRTLHALAVLLASYLAERKAVQHSDVLIALTERDSRLLRRVYGRGATYISPMALEDRRLSANDAASGNVESRDKRYLLFVGGAFYANRLGIAWFVENVAPRIRIKTVVVGKGFETLKTRLETKADIEIVGAVQNLSEWYLNAHCVIAPIFDGSGMKTKVAEALMFGKKVIGAPEAFSGYENVTGQAGWTCATADEFVDAIDRIERVELPAFDLQVRALFDRNYSYDAARARLTRILEPLVRAKKDGSPFTPTSGSRKRPHADESVSDSVPNRGER
ncbi:MAG: glycosyltransferase family 4 protein [Methylocystis sp.]|nr:glycosyltransferase family 4 protein [Methylocystis sp.]